MKENVNEPALPTNVIQGVNMDRIYSLFRYIIFSVVTLVVTSMAVQAQTAPMAVLVNQGPNINGEIKGSIQQMQAASVNLNSGAVITGNLYVPGTPGVNKNGSPSFLGIESGGGSATPNNYWITLNSGSQLGYLIEQTNPATFSPVGNPPAPTGTRGVNVSQGSGSVSSQIGSWSTLRDLNLNSNVGAVSVPAGNYGTFNANSGTSFVLGTAGATTPSTYTFSSLTLNSSSNLTLLGPVVIVVQNSVSINSSCVFGNSTQSDLAGFGNRSEWTQH